MKLAIISDVHDNLANLKKVLKFIGQEKIDKLIILGDLGNADTLKYLKENFFGEIYYTYGNVERDIYQNYRQNDKLYKIIQIDNLKIVITHWPDIADKLADSKKYDLVFYGHTHGPDKKIIGKTILLNPGNIAGIRYAPTFAIYDINDNKIKLILINEIK